MIVAQLKQLDLNCILSESVEIDKKKSSELDLRRAMVQISALPCFGFLQSFGIVFSTQIKKQGY